MEDSHLRSRPSKLPGAGFAKTAASEAGKALSGLAKKVQSPFTIAKDSGKRRSMHLNTEARGALNTGIQGAQALSNKAKSAVASAKSKAASARKRFGRNRGTTRLAPFPHEI